MAIPKIGPLTTQTLPQTGYIRLDKLLIFVPFSGATVWRKVRKHQFPQPVKLSDRVTAWRCEDVRDWLDSFHDAKGNPIKAIPGHKAPANAAPKSSTNHS